MILVSCLFNRRWKSDKSLRYNEMKRRSFSAVWRLEGKDYPCSGKVKIDGANICENFEAKRKV